MAVSAELQRLIDTAAPYWGAEAEVFRTYWTWEKRTRETDRKCLQHQCYKEIWGSGLGDKALGLFLGPVEELCAAFPKIDIEMDRHEVLDICEGLRAEFAHYCAFADAYDALNQPGDAKLNPRVLTWWKEDEALANLRYSHIEEHGRLGKRACRFTEGGYCSLFSEGMKLRDHPTPGHEKVDLLIAQACSKVYDDEFGHMLKGMVGLDQEGLSDAEWTLLADISLEQLRCRLTMRNAQFSHPVSEVRMQQLIANGATPLAFDYDHAKLAPVG